MSGYRHQWWDQTPMDLPVGKIVCVGRNYAAHAVELNNPIPTEPLLFMKPASALTPLDAPIRLPQDRGAVHFETELAVLIGQRLTAAAETDARGAIIGYGLALDLTLRDLQARLKENGHPWERAKAFDGACPLSPFIPPDQLGDPAALRFTLELDGKPRQTGNTDQMLTPVLPLIAHISQTFTLEPGDVVLTGTPEGVGELTSGQTLTLTLGEMRMGSTTVV
ncbi:2-keto-4-pentenoate hydratase/2-oxohepta-3-ene-1,7-dioic acid hydratase in catechol pathway [Tamilnaduibacter salinus]|uniref:2-keto-4-pentenoate hydratase/2-oxohepta-3-ene-1,7-dioic acid hydratase in catechol pathway n=1 Tax=Tamilnaduibacter salinus TaxID=1484056 RepID=A0A2U1CUB8_9GAMM|nr:fumarylacetoacetate hydrolase family protein [Tamilnaduibacter salinus]PVY70649.1 2-keto-4-pentenoate hydratase/2-oxohepta-3-ene-1,7-dioic acid hydratase in catechol pathway [Tamilnaduibacter salinus]